MGDKLMKRFLGKRIIESVIVLIVISFIAFAVVYFSPGEISALYIKPGMTEEQQALIREKYGADEGFLEQYCDWATSALQGDFGVSLVSQYSVIEELMERLPSTLILMGGALVLSILLSIPLGLLAGYYKNKIPDHIISGISYIGVSIPQFWLGMILIIIFASVLHLLPSSGMHTVGVRTTSDTIKHLILPWITLCLTNMASYLRYIRSNTIRELQEEYVLTARSKGTSDGKILFRHVLKNTLISVITLIGMNLSSIVAGSFVLEAVFGWPGVGTYALNAIQSRDYPVIMAYTMLVGIILVAGNLIADLMYAIVDPRIRQGMEVDYE
jgi:peptide/nickel transport system permease protein